MKWQEKDLERRVIKGVMLADILCCEHGPLEDEGRSRKHIVCFSESGSSC